MTEEKKTFICLKDAISVVYRTKHMVDLTDSMKSVVVAKDAIVLGLEKLPTIEEPKTGHWTWELDETPSTYMSPSELNYAGWVCSCCREFPDDVCEWDDPDEPPTYKFCPNCGAKMESEDKE